MPDGARGSIFAVLLISAVSFTFSAQSPFPQWGIRMTFLALRRETTSDVFDVFAVCIAGPLEHFALHLVK